MAAFPKGLWKRFRLAIYRHSNRTSFHPVTLRCRTHLPRCSNITVFSFFKIRRISGIGLGGFYNIYSSGQTKVVREGPERKIVTKMVRDVSGDITRIVMPSGHGYGYTYDNAGNLLTAKDGKLGGNYRFSYEPVFNNFTQMVGPGGEATPMEYDEQGNLTGLTSPEGRTMRASCSPEGLVTESTLHDKI